MSKIRISVNHKLGKQAAMERIRHLTKNGGKELSTEISELTNVWKNDTSEFTCVVRGIKINGVLEFTDNIVTVSGAIPFVFFPVKHQIEKVIRLHAAQIFA